MLDELREQADQSSLLEDEEDSAAAYFRRRYQTDRPLFGMTAGQRLILAAMLLLMTVILGSFCLLVTQRVVPPILF